MIELLNMLMIKVEALTQLMSRRDYLVEQGDISECLDEVQDVINKIREENQK